MTIKILIVDDHELVRQGLHSVLSQATDIEIVADAIDGETAVSKSLENNPDLVLMDIRMPIMDGIEATRQIKDKIPTTRVLILASNDNKDDVFEALAAGADGYCLKDTHGKELINAIRTIYTGASWLDPQIAQLVLRAVSAQAKSSTPTASAFALSPRELDILRLLVDGLSNNDMAARLFISSETVRTHMKHIMEKLKVSDRTQAALKAMREGLV